MTPADLLAACREAWPETEASRWEDASAWRGDCTAEREWSGRLHIGARVTLLRQGSADVLCTGDVIDPEMQPYSEPEILAAPTPSGVREVVTALRAWCREEARRLAAEVDPGGGWLPVTDDAPPAGEEVLVVGSWAGMRVGMRLEDGAWAGAGYSLRDIGATAVRWRPLPAPPGSAPSGSKR